jgi:ferredoxin-NADP reductase
MIAEPNERYVVKEKVAEAPGVFTLRLSREGGALPHYAAGQFVTVYIPELRTPQGKAYSISSAPGENTLDITVKKIGAFSGHLCALNPGDTVIASEPCGYFFSESASSTLVMAAAGIGVAPYRSIILDCLQKNPQRKLVLFYSSRTVPDIIFKKLFDELCAAHKNMSVAYFVTREENISPPMLKGRIQAQRMLQDLSGAPDPEFLLCGSIAFVRDMWRDLRAEGVSEDKIYTEAFFSH